MLIVGISDFKIFLEDSASVPGTIPLAEMYKDDGGDYPVGIPDDFDFENDIAILPYSSGTTGLAKGVMCHHKCLVANMEQCIYGKDLLFIRKAAGDCYLIN